jgi:hypothetical protein
MSPTVRFAWAFVAWLPLASACASGGSEAGPVDEDELVPAIVEAVCELHARCDCEMPLTADECRMTIEPSIRTFFDPANASGLTYDAACAGDALARYDELGCLTLTEVAEQGSCAGCRIYYGSKRLGEACELREGTLFDDCGQGLYCIEALCVDPCDPAGEGEACIGRPCAEGLECHASLDPDTEVVTSECVAQAGAGEACVELSCADELVCDETSICEAAPQPGEACAGECASGSWCDTSEPDSAAWVCRAAQPDGAACQSGRECESETCDPEAQLCTPSEPFVCGLAQG